MKNHLMIPDPGYYTNYILKAPEGDILIQLEKQLTEVRNLYSSLSEVDGNYAYSEGKWSVKEILGHLMDAERIFAYRILRFARNDKTPLTSFEENDFVANSFFSERTIVDLLNEYELTRKANLALFSSFNDTELKRTGTASNTELSVEQIIYIIAGHERHHLGVLKERYDIG
ncbi:MAG: DinB family protein [Bacteroidota bacterium]